MQNTFFIWAHRGASAWAPENTLTSFQMAEAMGAHGIELDVHMSRDGVPVVIHDDTLERTTNGWGRVSEWLLSDLGELDAGSWFGTEFAGERLPTLEEVLCQTGQGVRMNIEIKTAAAGEAVCELLKKHLREKALISSFNWPLLLQLHKSHPELSLGVLVESSRWRSAIQVALDCGAESLHPAERLVGPVLLSRCAHESLAVYPWTVDNPWRGKRLCSQGASGVFTNDPGHLLRFTSKATPRN